MPVDIPNGNVRYTQWCSGTLVNPSCQGQRPSAWATPPVLVFSPSDIESKLWLSYFISGNNSFCSLEWLLHFIDRVGKVPSHSWSKWWVCAMKTTRLRPGVTWKPVFMWCLMRVDCEVSVTSRVSRAETEPLWSRPIGTLALCLKKGWVFFSGSVTQRQPCYLIWWTQI